MRPPSAGPVTAATCQTPVRQATDDGYIARGTTSADSALRAGSRKLRAAPQIAMTP
jgi:hypothetical protein